MKLAFIQPRKPTQTYINWTAQNNSVGDAIEAPATIAVALYGADCSGYFSGVTHGGSAMKRDNEVYGALATGSFAPKAVTCHSFSKLIANVCVEM